MLHSVQYMSSANKTEKVSSSAVYQLLYKRNIIVCTFLLFLIRVTDQMKLYIRKATESHGFKRF